MNYSSDVILSRVFCGEGPMQLAGSTGAAKEFIGPSPQRTPLRMTLSWITAKTKEL
jgi:hypothetical protein